ncbi:hypothetical protein CDAR_250601 [Caerostris darwini]|uniref:Uncharacterized protein n=1 Tax=Caerostris darwini TaxID=1538125 RepID=A0AAV4RR38_9ARAC|nr:hypothetical protein CDAR_250601 [Caerostris darwini]
MLFMNTILSTHKQYISNKRHQYPLTIETKEHHKSRATHSRRRKSFCKILNLPHPCKRPEEFLAILYPPVPLEKWKLIVIAGDIDSVDIPGDKDSGGK